jgi:uncharacterized membrane protein
MNLRDPESMNGIIGNMLRVGVLASAAVIVLGAALLVVKYGGSDFTDFLHYDASTIPHGTFSVSLQSMVSGIASLEPYSIIELGVLLLIATPVSRVVVSTLLFAAEHDRTYVYVTLCVLGLLLFSMLATPFIPWFLG